LCTRQGERQRDRSLGYVHEPRLLVDGNTH
jgi:hypothetical protein